MKIARKGKLRGTQYMRSFGRKDWIAVALILNNKTKTEKG